MFATYTTFRRPAPAEYDGIKGQARATIGDRASHTYINQATIVGTPTPTLTTRSGAQLKVGHVCLTGGVFHGTNIFSECPGLRTAKYRMTAYNIQYDANSRTFFVEADVRPYGSSQTVRKKLPPCDKCIGRPRMVAVIPSRPLISSGISKDVMDPVHVRGVVITPTDAASTRARGALI
eukprot:tig00000654_g2826.t1